MSLIISFVQTKGGTGKTNLARSLAYSKPTTKSYPSICLVDMDEQGSLKNWWKDREMNQLKPGNVSFLHMTSSDKKLIQSQLENLTENFDLIILDVAGESVGRLYTQLALTISDLILIPMRTSTDDESAFESNLVPLIREVIKKSPDQRGRFHILPTFVHPRTNQKKVQEYFKSILPSYIHCLESSLPYRSIYENYSREGSNLYEYRNAVKSNSRDKKQADSAIKEIESLSVKISNLLGD